MTTMTLVGMLALSLSSSAVFPDRSVPVVNANSTISATFLPLQPDKVALTIVPHGWGHVLVVPTSNRYTNGQTVILTAIPEKHQQFTGWSGDAVGADNPMTITPRQSRVVYGMFTRKPWLDATA